MQEGRDPGGTLLKDTHLGPALPSRPPQASQGSPLLSPHPRLPFLGKCAVTHSGQTKRQRLPEISGVGL